MKPYAFYAALLMRKCAFGIRDGTGKTLLRNVPNLHLAIERAGGQEAVMEWRELEVGHRIGVGIEQRHGFALPATVVQRQHSHTGTRVLPVKGHERARRGNIVAIVLIRAHDNVANAHLRLRHDGSRILVFGRLKSPRHCSALWTVQGWDKIQIKISIIVIQLNGMFMVRLNGVL